MHKESYAVVTGSSSGIGLELTKRLVKEGYKVVGIGRNEERLKMLKAELQGGFEFIRCDIADPACLNEVKRSVENLFDHIDILVNNAGFAYAKPLLQHTPREVEEIFLVNAIRPIQLVLSLIDLLPRGSTVVNVISPAAFVLLRKMPTYTASKASFHILSSVLEKELSPRGVHVLRVYPGSTATQFFSRMHLDTPRYSLRPGEVADKILKCIKRKCSELYIPSVLSFLEVFSPKIPVW